MDKKDNTNNEKQGIGCIIAFLFLFTIIVIPIIISMISNTIKDVKETKHESQLISEGKSKAHKEVINEIIESLKSKDEIQMKEFLAKDFIYYDSEHIEHKYISDFFKDLKNLSSSYEIERRGDVNQSETATYWIYWNVVEKNKIMGIHKSDTNYCLQRIYVYLNRVVKENEITYEIEKIILKDR